MKTWDEAWAFANKLLVDGPYRHTKSASHFGKCEIRELLDYIYEYEVKVETSKVTYIYDKQGKEIYTRVE